MSTIKNGTLVVIDPMNMWSYSGLVCATRRVATGREYYVRYGREQWDAVWVDAERIVTAAYLRKVLLSGEKHAP